VIVAKKSSKPLGRKAMAKAIEFVEEYIANGRNGRQAYLKVYTSTTNEGTAAVEACKLLKNPNVSAYLEEREQELRAKYRLSTDDVIKNLSQSLYFDPRKLYKPDGSLKSITDLDEDTIVGLAAVEVVEMAGGLKIDTESGPQHVPMFTKKLKWHDKTAIREQAMKHLGLFSKDKDPALPPTVNVSVKLPPGEAYLRMLRRDGRPKKKA
jgi:phage terminase small subunit